MMMSGKMRILMVLCAVMGVVISSHEDKIAASKSVNLEEDPVELGTQTGDVGGGAEDTGEGTGTEASAEDTGPETEGETEESIGTEAGEEPTGTDAVPTVEPIGAETSGSAEDPKVLNTEFDVGEDADWLFTLAIENPPEDQTTIKFKEGVEEEVGLGEETTSFLFKEGTLQDDGMLDVPIYVKDHETPKMISFMVSINGKDTQITVNLIANEPLFKVQQNPIKAKETSQWKFTLQIMAKTELSYTFKEGDEQAEPRQNTTSLQFGTLEHKAEGNIYEVEVTVRDLSKNNLTFDVTSGESTETVTVNIDPPAKPLLLKNQFSVGKDDDYTFTLEIKAKDMPEVSFSEGDKTAKTGENTQHFTFGTMTQDEENLYEIQVKVSEDIDDLSEGSWKFTATLDKEDNEVTVTSESQSSALRSASITVACFIWPLVVMLVL